MHEVSDTSPEQPTVAILLCTYNGERFLAEQLDSIIKQTHRNWVLYASDDGSKDRTIEILSKYQTELGEQKIVILEGPQQGFSKNFMSLIRNKLIEADYFAFSDQDDIWHEDKLERSVISLSAIGKSTPGLYCTRTHLIDENGNSIGHSPLFQRKPSFNNALVQSLAGGNTMLINQKTRKLLEETPFDSHIVSHDWLTYLIVSGCNGAVIYDSKPSLEYRQHTYNVVGCHISLKDRVARFTRNLGGTLREYNEHNLKILKSYEHLLSSESKKSLTNYRTAINSKAVKKIFFLKKANVYRQHIIGNISLYMTAILGKM